MASFGKKRKIKRSRTDALFFKAIVAFIGFFFCVEVALFNYVEIEQNVASTPEKVGLVKVAKYKFIDATNRRPRHANKISLPEHLLPHIPILPLFDSIPDAKDHIANLLKGKATMAGVVALIQEFISDLHDKNMEVHYAKPDGKKGGEMILDNFYNLAQKHLKPFDDAYHGKHIFPVREDGSIFISLAAFREFYLLETLESAFKNAKNPEKVFVGALVQNCFGGFREDGSLDTSGTPCISGRRKVGVDKNGKDIVKIEKILPPDPNGVEMFCANPDYKPFCDNGQIRVVYMHHTDGQGPSMARYLTSKLWGGETYFMQIDSHLRFAYEWDKKFVDDIKLTSNYPKSVFSSYPPGFDQIRFIPARMGVNRTEINNETVIESPGCRLCHCSTPKGKDPMIHIKQSKSYWGNETRPAQQPFLGAGLVFAHADFLRDVPFDPYLPYTFMGEEILLSMRAWTTGWNMYAPRKNWIIHQYRPASLGLPKFYGSITDIFTFGMNQMQKVIIRRMKHLLGYPKHTIETIKRDKLEHVLVDLDKYNMGSVRTRQDFMEFSEIVINTTTGNLDCPERLGWCYDKVHV